MTVFRVPAGTVCKVRRVGGSEDDWRRYVTVRDTEFDHYLAADFGGTWIFTRDGWQMKVATRYVVGRYPKQPKLIPDPPPTFNATAFGRNGRGASRRAAARTLKSWKDHK